MRTDFYKYQGAGNDFILIDNRKDIFPKDNELLIRYYCHRQFGIGADGFMLLENSDIADFKMVYYNADGKPGSMCGNGGRCMVAFAYSLGLFDKETTFEAMKRLYRGVIEEKRTVSLGMTDVDRLETHETHVFLDTGSPHHVVFTDKVSAVNVVEEGRRIRRGEPYGKAGTNVNFVEQVDAGTFKVRTYERGVENETLSCGTGVTAVALASYHLKKTREKRVRIKTLGGNLEVTFEENNGRFTNIVLTGPATFVFKGEIEY